MEYSPSCIAGKHSGTQFPSFRGTRPIINGSHQLTTGPFPNQINPVYTSHPWFVRFISILLIYPPHLRHGRQDVPLDLKYYANKLCQTISAYTILHRYVRVYNFRSPSRRGDLFFFTVASCIGGSSASKFLHVNLLAPGILRWLLNFLERLCTPGL